MKSAFCSAISNELRSLGLATYATASCTYIAKVNFLINAINKRLKRLVGKYLSRLEKVVYFCEGMFQTIVFLNSSFMM